MTAQTPRGGKRATRELEKESVISASLLVVAVSPVFSSPTWWNCLHKFITTPYKSPSDLAKYTERAASFCCVRKLRMGADYLSTPGQDPL